MTKKNNRIFNPDNTIVYTLSIGQTEGLNEQPFINKSNFKKVCLTDDYNLKSSDWEIVNINRILPQDQYRSQRNLKIRPHLIFPEYQYSFYFDNTIVLKKTPEDFIKEIFSRFNFKEDDPFFILPRHSFRDTLIDEFHECYAQRLDTDVRFFDQIYDYLLTNIELLYQKPFATGILLRNHMNKKLINFSEIWFSHIVKYTRRDQLSILHSAEQAKFKLNGFDFDMHSSDFHKYPVVKNERLFRSTADNLYELPSDFFDKIVKKIYSKNVNNQLIFKKIREDAYEHKLSMEKLRLSIEKLSEENYLLKKENKLIKNSIRDLENSNIWKYSSFLRKIMDRLKRIL